MCADETKYGAKRAKVAQSSTKSSAENRPCTPLGGTLCQLCYFFGEFIPYIYYILFSLIAIT